MSEPESASDSDCVRRHTDFLYTISAYSVAGYALLLPYRPQKSWYYYPRFRHRVGSCRR